MNLVLAAAGANLAKPLRLLPCAWRAWLDQWNFAWWITAHRPLTLKLAA